MMVKILHVYPQLMCGGTETVFYSLIKASDKTKFQYDILVQCPGQQEHIFQKQGCNIITIPYVDSKQYHSALADFFAKNKYQAVHCHMFPTMDIVLEEARKANILHCIAHSHNARTDVPYFLWPLRYFKHHKYEKFATDFLGCSELALKWLFPRCWRKGIVIYNGIDLDEFQFDAHIRQLYRAKLNVKDDTKVVINVGRCTDQKNHKFILDCAKNLIAENILFVIIGEGPLMECLQNRIKEENITNVRMLGKQFDVPQWLCAADLFMFPSIYEGLGIVAIEAQANGLPVLSTDSIPLEADMHMGLFHRISLQNIEKWKNLLCSTSISDDMRKSKSAEAYNSKYNIKKVVKVVENIYLKQDL